MDLLNLFLNNGYNPFTGQSINNRGLGYKPPRIYGRGKDDEQLITAPKTTMAVANIAEDEDEEEAKDDDDIEALEKEFMEAQQPQLDIVAKPKNKNKNVEDLVGVVAKVKVNKSTKNKKPEIPPEIPPKKKLTISEKVRKSYDKYKIIPKEMRKADGLENILERYGKNTRGDDASNLKTDLKRAYERTIRYGLDLLKIDGIDEDTTEYIMGELKTYLEILNELIVKGNKWEIEEPTLSLVEVPPEEKDKEDTYYKTLALQRTTYGSVNPVEWAEFEKNNPQLMVLYNNLQLENINNNLAEIDSGYIKPEGLDTTHCDLFEECFTNQNETINFIHQIAPNFISTNIANIEIINTGVDSVNFKKDENFPVDIIVIITYNDGTIKKYAIELKYYDNQRTYTGIARTEETKTGKILKPAVKETGDLLDYSGLCREQLKLYNDFKQNKFKDIGVLEEQLIDAEEFNDKKEIKKLTKEIIKLKEFVLNIEEFNEYFKKNYYGFYVAMKFTKTGFSFGMRIFKNKKTGIERVEFEDINEERDEGDYNTKETYKHLQKFKSHSQRLLRFYPDTGYIKKTVSGIKGKEYKSKNFLLLQDCELLFCVSYKDVILGLNYSEKIKNKPLELHNPFYKQHLVKSAYEKKTETVGFDLGIWTLIKRIPKPKKIKKVKKEKNIEI